MIRPPASHPHTAADLYPASQIPAPRPLNSADSPHQPAHAPSARLLNFSPFSSISINHPHSEVYRVTNSPFCFLLFSASSVSSVVKHLLSFAFPQHPAPSTQHF